MYHSELLFTRACSIQSDGGVMYTACERLMMMTTTSTDVAVAILTTQHSSVVPLFTVLLILVAGTLSYYHYSLPSGGAEYWDERACLFVCLSVCLILCVV